MKREEGNVGGEMRGGEWPLCEGKVRERREVREGEKMVHVPGGRRGQED